MIYGERVKYAREKLGMDRMEFAAMLGTTQENIRNIENCKDESKKLGFEKMQKLIDVAKLPAGYFFYSCTEVKAVLMAGKEIFLRPTTNTAEVTTEELLRALEVIRRLE